MISRELLSWGYDAGLVRIVDSPMGDGAVCAIGENWFYFGGLTAEQHSAAEYAKAVPREDILNEIFMVLEDFRREAGDFGDEYMYYDSYLREKCQDEEKSFLSFSEIGEVTPPYILKFVARAIPSRPETAMMVVLDRSLNSNQVDELEDSIATYIENVEEWNLRSLIADVLGNAGYRYAVLEPSHTYEI